MIGIFPDHGISVGIEYGLEATDDELRIDIERNVHDRMDIKENKCNDWRIIIWQTNALMRINGFGIKE